MALKRAIIHWLPDWCMCGDRLPSLADVWERQKCDHKLIAKPRLLISYADPAAGHDGALYLAAGATPCGAAKNGKLLFAWGLEPFVTSALDQLRATFS